MNLPVFGIASATLRDLWRVPLRHPFAVLFAVICSIVLAYWFPSMEPGSGVASFGQAVRSSASLLLEMMAWLPLWLIAIREVASGQAMALRLAGRPSAATVRYAAYTAAILLTLASISLIDWDSPAKVASLMAAMLGATWFLLRTTLTFTSLALGRLDLGFARSIARTSGQTLRLLAIAFLPFTALALIVLAAIGLAIATDLAPELESPHWPIMAAVTGQFGMLAATIAGAHIYRRLEGAPPQNGRY